MRIEFDEISFIFNINSSYASFNWSHWLNCLVRDEVELAFNTMTQFNADGQIIEEWRSWDHLDALQQIGVLPSTDELLAQFAN